MRQRRRDTEPVVGKPRPRTVAHHWIMHVPTIVYTIVAAAILGAAAGQGR